MWIMHPVIKKMIPTKLMQYLNMFSHILDRMKQCNGKMWRVFECAFVYVVVSLISAY